MYLESGNVLESVTHCYGSKDKFGVEVMVRNIAEETTQQYRIVMISNTMLIET